MSPSRRALAPVAALLVLCATLGACASEGDVAVLDTTVVTWPAADGSTSGQVIVAIRNDAERPVDPDVLGNDRLTLAHLLDADGEDLPGGDARVQLHAVPHILGPGETGHLLGSFEIDQPADGVDGARVELNTAVADPPVPVAVEGFELVESVDGVGAIGRLEWDGSGTAVARAIALDADGRVLGYLSTSEVLYAAGDFTMCCFPPTVTRDDIDDVVVYADQAREE